MLDLRLHRSSSLLCRLFSFASLAGVSACTPLGDHDASTPGDIDCDAACGAAAEPALAREGHMEPAIAADDDARCSSDGPPTEASPIDPDSAPEQGRMAVRQGDTWLGLPLRETRYDTVVVGTIAETSVVQVFHNPLPDRLEARYNFPLPADAAVDDYWIRVDGKQIHGVMKRRDEARKTYEAARDAGQTAALLEQNRPNVFAQAVANIPPGGTVEVEIHLVQPLRREDGRYELVLPTVIGPRYISGAADWNGNTAAVPDAASLRSPQLAKGVVSCSKVEVQVTIEAGAPVRELRSQYHALQIERAGAITHLELADGPARANRDFSLSWQLAGLEPRAQLMAQKTGNGEGYFTLTIEPPRGISRDQARPRELVFVVDTSGSMSGLPLDTARSAVRKALADLGPDDTFQLIRFAGSAEQVAPEPLTNTADNRQRALAFLEQSAGSGGTEMMAGITAALARPADPQRLRMVLFLTDGFIGGESQIFAEIERQLGQARLFGLGVGSSVNRYLLDGMGRIGRGSTTYVGPGEDPDEVVKRFYSHIDRPVLTDIEIDWGSLPIADLSPAVIPDLFAGQPVVVFGRFTGAPQGQALLKGKLGGAPISIPLKLDFSQSQAHSGLASMWARRHVDDLLGYPSARSGSPDTAAVTAVTELALKHRIMTAYTSFVAVEQREEKQTDGTLRTIEVPLELPLGVENSATDESGSLGGLGLVGLGRGGSGYGGGYARGAGAGFGGRGVRVPTVRLARAEVYTSIDKDFLRRTVRAHINEVRYCYDQGLARNPNLKGRVSVRFTIGPKGQILEAELADNTTGDLNVGLCIVAAVKRWTFPIPEGGEAIVIYPFVLEPG
ncbi:MAG: AgmX/PglI C-terminal domain-containing protein [Nannocystis sp.]|nr:VIT domain-containing protein [Nannocystis sp.]MBA3550389.1 AgmX/PglI C-terminal domain-containing protein [Nannocystis sp.]